MMQSASLSLASGSNALTDPVLTVACGDLTDSYSFIAKRRAIRVALATDGVAAEIEALVDALLPP
jgi:hypothetical protein